MTTADPEDDDHVHTVAIYIKVCQEPTHHVADVDVWGNDSNEAARSVANALRSLANVIDTEGTFEELVQGL